MTQKLANVTAKLDRLDDFLAQLAWVEQQREDAIEKGTDVDNVDRQATRLALVHVITFLDGVGGNAQSLRRLGAALHDPKSPLLVEPRRRGDKSIGPIIECLQGKLAGVVELHVIASGGDANQSATWVAKHLPANLSKFLAPKSKARVTWRAVKDWYGIFGGKRGKKGLGRDDYLKVLKAGIQGDRVPSEASLILFISTIARSPGVPE